MARPSSSPSCCGCCSRRNAVLFLIISAIPFSFIFSSSSTSSSSYSYTGSGLFRECAKWDPQGRRFLASTFLTAALVEIRPSAAAAAAEERVVVAESDVAGYGSLGLAVDPARGRVLVVFGDPVGKRLAAVGAYRLDTWDRIFLTRLAGPDDEPSLADDVAVDHEGNAYVTDAKANKIWKVGANGELLSVIRSNVFTQRKEWYRNFVGLNGIVYHPNSYLLVIHTSSGQLFKFDPLKGDVSVVRVKGSLLMGDGLELISPTKLAVAGSIASRVVESSDDWETATVTGRYIGPLHRRLATSATVKDGKVYLNYLVGWGLKKSTHVIREAVFTPLNTE